MKDRLRRAFVGRGGQRKMGFIDSSGELVIPANFSGGFDFTEGVGVVVQPESGLMGCVDADGKYVLEPMHRRLFPRADKYYRFSPGVGMGFLDERGRAASIALQQEAGDFAEGLAAVRGIGDSFVSIIRTDGALIRRSYAPNLLLASEGLMPFCNEGTGKFGYINLVGEIAIEPIYEFARSFAGGVAAVTLKRNKSGLPMAGFVTKQGEIHIVETATDCQSYHDGYAVFSSLAGRKTICGVVDSNHRVVVAPMFSLIGRFVAGLAPAKMPSGKWGFIGSNGEWKIQPDYDDAESFRHGLAEVRQDDMRLYLRPDGSVAWQEYLE